MSLLYQLRIDQDTSTVLADNDLLVELQVYLTLGGNFIEATSASITVNRNNSQSVTGSFTDAAKGMKQTLLNPFLSADGLCS